MHNIVNRGVDAVTAEITDVRDKMVPVRGRTADAVPREQPEITDERTSRDPQPPAMM